MTPKPPEQPPPSPQEQPQPVTPPANVLQVQPISPPTGSPPLGQPPPTSPPASPPPTSPYSYEPQQSMWPNGSDWLPVSEGWFSAPSLIYVPQVITAVPQNSKPAQRLKH